MTRAWQTVSLAGLLALGGCVLSLDLDDDPPPPREPPPPVEKPDPPEDCELIAEEPEPDTRVCNDLAGELVGLSPFGAADFDLTLFEAGDCLSITRAGLSFRNAEGDTIWITFTYPVDVVDGKREVPEDFTRDASVRFTDACGRGEEVIAKIAVDVETWVEGDEAHSVDIVVNVDDPAFDLAPIAVRGTFCDWPYFVCAAP